jgi:hypothetical protein
MRRSELKNKLIAAARAHAPSERVPYAFEKRVMAQILSRSKVDAWAQWAHGLWRSAVACLAFVLLLGTVSVFTLRNNPQASGDLSQEFEKTLLAALDSDYSR